MRILIDVDIDFNVTFRRLVDRGPEIFLWLSAPFLKAKVAAKVRDLKI